MLIFINLNQFLISGLAFGLKYLYETKGPLSKEELKILMSLESQFKILVTDACFAFTYYTTIVTVFMCYVKGDRNISNINVDELM